MSEPERSYRHFPGTPDAEKNQAGHQSLRDWFKWLYHNKGERAALRRCTCPDEVFMTAGFRNLQNQFYDSINPGSDRYLALACAAGVISHVKEDIVDEQKTFAKQMARNKKDSDQPMVSELRLSQLQKSYSWEEFYRRLIRTVKLVGGEVNVVSLADDIFHWGKEFNGQFERKPMNRLQVRWAADYYHILNQKKKPSQGK